LNLRATAAFNSGMPSTAVYFDALPSRIALMAASLMVVGGVKCSPPAPNPDPSAARRFERARFIRDSDGRRRLDARGAVRKKGHYYPPMRRCFLEHIPIQPNRDVL